MEVAWENEPAGDSIAVTLGAQTRYIRTGTFAVNYGYGTSGNQTIVSPQVVAFEVDADGAAGTISAAFTTNGACSASGNFTAPAACPPTTCASDQTGGTVFNDYDADGVKDVGETNGRPGATVTAYDCDGVAIATAVTDAYGIFAFSGLTLADYPIRVEFSNYGTGTQNGADGRTNVQFVDAPDCHVDLGVLDPNDYCQTNPMLFVPCFVNGDPLLGGTAGTADAAVMFPYENTGIAGQSGYLAPSHVATASQVGTLWGTAYNRDTKRAFQSATLKRHSGLGPLGIGGIYVTDFSNLAAPVVSNFIDVEADLGIDVDNPASQVPSNAARALPADKTAPSNDPDIISHIGRSGLGDIDISPGVKFMEDPPTTK